MGSFVRLINGMLEMTAVTAADIPNNNADTTGSAFSFTGSLLGDITGTQGATVVSAIQGTAVTGTTGTGNVVFSASPTLTGTLSAASAIFSSTISASNFSGSSSGTNSGDVTLSAFGSVPNANAASLIGQALTLQPADGTHPGGVSTTTQTFGGNKTFTGTISASNLSGTNSGDVTLTAVGSSPNANAASLSGQALTLQPADGTHPGVLTSGTQTIGGNKTFTGTISASNLSGTNSGDVTLSAFGSTPSANGASLSGQVLTLQPADATHPGGISLVDQTMGSGNKLFPGNISSNAGIYAAGELYGGAVFGGGATRYSQLAQHSLSFINASAVASKIVDNEVAGQSYWYNFSGNSSIYMNSDGIVNLGTYGTTSVGELQVAPGGPVNISTDLVVAGHVKAPQLLADNGGGAQIAVNPGDITWNQPSNNAEIDYTSGTGYFQMQNVTSGKGIQFGNGGDTIIGTHNAGEINIPPGGPVNVTVALNVGPGDITASNGNIVSTVGAVTGVFFEAPSLGAAIRSHLDSADLFFYEGGNLTSGLTDSGAGHVYLYNYVGAKSIDIYSDGTVSLGSFNGSSPVGELQVAPGGPVNISTSAIFTTAGGGIQIKTGSNARAGTATLVAGTVTVANTSVTANTLVFYSVQTAGGVQGFLSSTKIASTSFTITSTSLVDTSTVAWLLIEGN